MGQFGDVEAGVRVCTAFRMKTVSDISFNAGTEKVWSAAAGYTDVAGATAIRLTSPITYVNGNQFWVIGATPFIYVDGSTSAALILDRGSSASTASVLHRDGGAERWLVGLKTGGSQDYSIQNVGSTGNLLLLPLGDVGIKEASPSSALDVAGNIEVGAANWHYWGDPTTNSSWRFGRSGDDMVMERRGAGAWVTKHTFED